MTGTRAENTSVSALRAPGALGERRPGVLACSTGRGGYASMRESSFDLMYSAGGAARAAARMRVRSRSMAGIDCQTRQNVGWGVGSAGQRCALLEPCSARVFDGSARLHLMANSAPKGGILPYAVGGGPLSDARSDSCCTPVLWPPSPVSLTSSSSISSYPSPSGIEVAHDVGGTHKPSGRAVLYTRPQPPWIAGKPCTTLSSYELLMIS